MASKKKIVNRKGAEAPRGLNVRGLPTDVLEYLTEKAKDATLSVEAYVRSKIVEYTRKKMTADR